MSTVLLAILAPVAALAGVFLAQLFQARRDRITHERELEREDGRRQSEANTRFMEFKLTAFSDFLGDVYEFERLHDNVLLGRERAGLTEGQKTPDPDHSTFLHKTLEMTDKFDASYFRLELLTTPTVADMASKVYLGLSGTIEYALDGRSNGPDNIVDYRRYRQDILEMMKAELADDGVKRMSTSPA